MQGTNNTGQTPGQGGNKNNGNQQQSGLSWSQPASGGASTPPVVSVQNKPAPAQQKPASPAKVSSPDPAATKRLSMIAGAVVVVAVLIFAWIFWGGGSTPGAATDTNGNTTASTTQETGGASAVAGENTLVPVSPQDAGLEVMISSASVSAPTWVVVYEAANGEPGRALGATLFFPANNGKSGTVSLLRATEPGQSYLIGENIDSGDRVFALHGDAPVVDSAGQPVWYTFTTR